MRQVRRVSVTEDMLGRGEEGPKKKKRGGEPFFVWSVNAQYAQRAWPVLVYSYQVEIRFEIDVVTPRAQLYTRSASSASRML
jgi:hypothetical protein